MPTKKTTKKFQLLSKYDNYPTWDEKQNCPTNYNKSKTPSAEDKPHCLVSFST